METTQLRFTLSRSETSDRRMGIQDRTGELAKTGIDQSGKGCQLSHRLGPVRMAEGRGGAVTQRDHDATEKPAVMRFSEADATPQHTPTHSDCDSIGRRSAGRRHGLAGWRGRAASGRSTASRGSEETRLNINPVEASSPISRLRIDRLGNIQVNREHEENWSEGSSWYWATFRQT